MCFQVLKANNSKFKLFNLTYRNVQNDARTNAFRRQNASMGAGRAISTTPLMIGQGAVAGASLLGLGALAFYGLGFSSESGIVEKSALWPQMVRDRLKATYGYVAASLGVAGVSAAAAIRSRALLQFYVKSPIAASLIPFALVWAAMATCRSIPYEEGNSATKHVAWLAFAALLGVMGAPVAFYGRAVLIRAAWSSLGIVGGLSTVAATAPSEKFLNMAGPLGIGLGFVLVSSIGSIFLPPTTRLGMSLFSIALYGGLILFSAFLLYDTQKIVKHAENSMHYDPINHSMSLFLDIFNIFINMATILSGGNRRK